MGTSFVGKVRDVRQIAEAQIGEGVADMVELEAQASGHEATEKANRIQAWQGLLDWQLADRFDRDRPVLLSKSCALSSCSPPPVGLVFSKISKHYISNASRQHFRHFRDSISGFFGDIFGRKTLSKKRCFSTQGFTRFLSTVSSQCWAVISRIWKKFCQTSSGLSTG